MGSYKVFIKKPVIVNLATVPKEEQEFLKSPGLDQVQHPIHKRDAATITPNRVLQLQRLIGNLATSRILGNSSVIQRGQKHGKATGNQDKKEKKEKKQHGDSNNPQKDSKLNFEEVAMEVSDGYDHNQIQDQLIAYIKDSKWDVDVRLMAKQINKIMQLITNKEFEAAYKILTSSDNLAAINYTIDYENDVDIYPDDDLETMLKTAIFMHFPDKRHIKISDIYFDGEHFLKLKPPDIGAKAPLILATMLEEWIHAFQNLIQGNLSDCIQDFKEFTERKKDEFGLDGWSLNELDIFTIYQELGWNNLLDNFADRYEERKIYKEYVEAKRGKERCATTTIIITSESFRLSLS